MHTSTSVGAFALVLPAVLGWGCGGGPTLPDSLTGRVAAGTTIVFDHLSGDWWGDYPPAIVEQLTSSSTLVITGSIVVSERGGRLDGTLDGRLDVMSQDGVMPTASCHASDHSVVLTR